MPTKVEVFLRCQVRSAGYWKLHSAIQAPLMQRSIMARDETCRVRSRSPALFVTRRAHIPAPVTHMTSPREASSLPQEKLEEIAALEIPDASSWDSSRAASPWPSQVSPSDITA